MAKMNKVTISYAIFSRWLGLKKKKKEEEKKKKSQTKQNKKHFMLSSPKMTKVSHFMISAI